MLSDPTTATQLLQSSKARLIAGVLVAAVVTGVFFIPQFPTNASTSLGMAATPQATAAAVATERQALALHVGGNQLLNAQGIPVILHGVTRDQTDFLCAEGKGIFDGPTDQRSIAGLLTWHINSVRIPLNEGCWLGIGGLNPAYSGTAYQAVIHAYVDALTAQGIYVLLDLHKVTPGNEINIHTFHLVPDADHSVTFWQQVATQYKDNRMVLFELYNEPWAVSWSCLRDGGQCAGVPYRVAGMQSLVNAVRRAGATNVALIPGLNFTNDLSQWLAYEPSDPLHNIAASWHVYMGGYSWKCFTVTCYDNTLAPVAAKVPLISTEFGVDSRSESCAPALEDGIPILLNWLDVHAAGYVAFTWNVGTPSCGSLSLITDYSGTPHAPNGTFIKQHLADLAGANCTSRC